MIVSLCALIACALGRAKLCPRRRPTAGGAGFPSVVELPSADRQATDGLLATASGKAATDQAEPAVDGTSLRPNGALLVTLPWGSGAGEVGFADTAEGLSRGPEALAVAPDGRIAVLDSVNSRLMLLDPTGRPFATAQIPLSAPRFLAVDDDELHVLDCDADRQLITFDWNGTDIGAVSVPELSDVVTGLFATDQGPCVEVSHETVVLLTPAGGAFRASAIRSSEPNLASGRILAGRPLNRSLDRVAQATFEPGRTLGSSWSTSIAQP